MKDSDIPWHLSEAGQTEFDRRFSTFPCPAGFGSALKCPFTDASWLKGNDFVHLLSSIGIFALGTFLPLDQRRVLQKLCRALHGLSRTALKLSELTVLEMELVETLTEWEIYFPFLSCTINIHLILHLPSQIARSEPLLHMDVQPRARGGTFGGRRLFSQMCGGIHCAKLCRLGVG